jgi:hypothetical protein
MVQAQRRCSPEFRAGYAPIAGDHLVHTGNPVDSLKAGVIGAAAAACGVTERTRIGADLEMAVGGFLDALRLTGTVSVSLPLFPGIETELRGLGGLVLTWLTPGVYHAAIVLETFAFDPGGSGFTVGVDLRLGVASRGSWWCFLSPGWRASRLEQVSYRVGGGTNSRYRTAHSVPVSLGCSRRPRST